MSLWHSHKEMDFDDGSFDVVIEKGRAHPGTSGDIRGPRCGNGVLTHPSSEQHDVLHQFMVCETKELIAAKICKDQENNESSRECLWTSRR